MNVVLELPFKYNYAVINKQYGYLIVRHRESHVHRLAISYTRNYAGHAYVHMRTYPPKKLPINNVAFQK